MNQRILHLAASHFPRDGEGNISATPEMIMEFAEVIVRECARVYWNIDDSETHGEYVKALKEHFGVE